LHSENPGLAENEERSDDLLDKLILDIKALVLLHGTDADLQTRLQNRIVHSHDESVNRFVSSLQVARKPDTTRLTVIAVGELLLASLLIVAGAVALAPNLAGASSPQAVLNYFISQISNSVSNSPIYQFASLVTFLVGTALLLSAFYTLRQAALNLREMGLILKQGEE